MSDRALSNAEVALLGLLSEKPKHAWQIEKDVEFRDMRSWTDLSQSSIYKQLRALESDGSLSSESQVVGGRARKVYALTERGAAALGQRLLDILADPEPAKSRIDIATYNLDLVPRDSAIEALAAYRTRLREAAQGYADLDEYLRTSGCPAHRRHVARRPLHLLAAEMEWVGELIDELEGE